MTDPIICVHTGRSTWQGPASAAPRKEDRRMTHDPEAAEHLAKTLEIELPIALAEEAAALIRAQAAEIAGQAVQISCHPAALQAVRNAALREAAAAVGEFLDAAWTPGAEATHDAILALIDTPAPPPAEPAGPTREPDYDMSIHQNPDARAWAAFFAKTFPDCNVDEGTMLGWFANAMMAMHDHLRGGGPLNGDMAEYMLDNPAPQPEEEIVMQGLTDDRSGLVRFGHHPDPAIDFCIEVETLQSRLHQAQNGLSKPGTDPEPVSAVLKDIQHAMQFTVGGDEGAVAAKRLLRELEQEAAPQPDPEGEICPDCMGSGEGGHPDSGYACHRCKGSGWIEEPQPDTDEREAMVEVIAQARGRFAPSEMAWAGDGYHDEDRAVADALLAAGWTRKREEG